MYDFACCHTCVAPKRHLGCHGHCPEYKEAKDAWEAKKNRLAKEREKETLIRSVLVSSKYKD